LQTNSETTSNPRVRRPNAAGGRATLTDVARAAGVSPSTASRALNGRGELSPATRAAVVTAAKALNFRPSRLARSLRAQRTQTLGFVVPDISAPFYAAVLRAAQEVLDAHEYRLILMNTDWRVDGEVNALETLLDHPIDGLLLATTGLPAAEFQRIIGDTVPCVFFDGILPNVGAGTVCVDNDEGMRLLFEHLVGHEHTRIALLAGLQTETSGIERVRGFHTAARELDVPVDASSIHPCEWSAASGERETTKLLTGGNRPTAIIAASDVIALGALNACRNQGLRVPDDIALVSFDDPQYANLIAPPITALASQPREIGLQAATLLLASLQGATPDQRDLRLPVQLIRRHSCGCGPETGVH
jgi:LacI family transcriptional regulator